MPFLGAIFDTAFKANRRNYRLLKTQLAGDRRQTAKDWTFVIVTILLVSASVALPFLILFEIVKHI